jgi:hypothetical protein
MVDIVTDRARFAVGSAAGRGFAEQWVAETAPLTLRRLVHRSPLYVSTWNCYDVHAASHDDEPGRRVILE